MHASVFHLTLLCWAAIAAPCSADVPAAPVTAPEAEPHFTASAGYMSSYLFNGLELGKDTTWASIEYQIPGLPIPMGFEAWYGGPDSGLVQRELDVALSSSAEVGGFMTSFRFAAFYYLEDELEDSYEMKVALERSIGSFDWSAAASYDFVIGGWFYETGLSREFSLNSKASLVLSTGIGYQDGYNSSGSAWNHWYAMAAVPITLKDHVTLEPYIAWLQPLDALEGIQKQKLHGGVTLRVEF